MATWRVVGNCVWEISGESCLHWRAHLQTREISWLGSCQTAALVPAAALTQGMIAMVMDEEETPTPNFHELLLHRRLLSAAAAATIHNQQPQVSDRIILERNTTFKAMLHTVDHHHHQVVD